MRYVTSSSPLLAPAAALLAGAAGAGAGAGGATATGAAGAFLGLVAFGALEAAVIGGAPSSSLPTSRQQQPATTLGAPNHASGCAAADIWADDFMPSARAAAAADDHVCSSSLVTALNCSIGLEFLCGRLHESQNQSPEGIFFSPVNAKSNSTSQPSHMMVVTISVCGSAAAAGAPWPPRPPPRPRPPPPPPPPNATVAGRLFAGTRPACSKDPGSPSAQRRDQPWSVSVPEVLSEPWLRLRNLEICGCGMPVTEAARPWLSQCCHSVSPSRRTSIALRIPEPT